MTPVTPPASAPASASTRGDAFRAIGWAGLVAGTLDLLFAWVVFPNTLVGTLKVIAGGWLGASARQGGAGVALLGLGSHYLIAFGAAATFWAASRFLPWLMRHAVFAGLVYGLVVYEFMHLVVLPLSAYHSPVKFASLLKADVLSHLFFVGLPIALIVRSGLATTERSDISQKAQRDAK
jgi:hypothetical protein